MLISLYSPSGIYDSKFLANYAYINLYDQLSRVPESAVFRCLERAVRDAIVGKADQLAKLAITVRNCDLRFSPE